MSNAVVLLVSAIQKQLFFKQAPRRRALGDLGIRYIAAYLNKNGVGADILPSYEYTSEVLVEYLKANSQIKAVGFSMHTISADDSLNDVRLVKKLFPHVKVWLGGFLPTFGWRFLLETDCPFDYIMRGDGEIASLELCKKIIAGDENILIQGIIARNQPLSCDKGFCQTVDLETLPFPYFTEKDRAQRVGEYMVSASRGCYGKCTFCSIPAFSDRRRERSVRSVVEEVKQLNTQFGATFIDFVDDSFLGAEGWEERAAEYERTAARLDANLPFRISLRANNISDSVLVNLKNAGMVAVQLGVESFSPRQLKLYNKGVTAARTLEAIRILERNEVYVQCGLILFEPSATLEDLKINADVLTVENWAVVKSNAQILYCAEGTALGERLKASGRAAGVEGYLNYRWQNTDGRLNIVHMVVTEYEKKLGGYSDKLVDVITPPSFISANRYKSMRLLQNEYQKLSFAVLSEVCDLAVQSDDAQEILQKIDARFGRDFKAVLSDADRILNESIYE